MTFGDQLRCAVMSSRDTPSPSPAAGWYPDPLDPASERLWDGERWSEHRRPASASAPAPISLQPPTTDRPPTERSRERSTAAWSAGSMVGVGVGLFALLSVAGCVVLVGVVPLVAVRSQNASFEEEFEVAVEMPPPTPTTVGPPPELIEEFPPTTIEPGAEVSDSVGPLAAYGSTVEVAGVLDLGEVVVVEITVDEPVDITEPVMASGTANVELVSGQILVAVPATVLLRDAPTDPFPAVGTFNWAIVGGATAATYRPADPAGFALGCDIVDDDLTAIEELSPGEARRGLVCMLIPLEDFEHPETRVVLSVGNGAPATWTR